jgi:hypothetical protein
VANQKLIAIWIPRLNVVSLNLPYSAPKEKTEDPLFYGSMLRPGLNLDLFSAEFPSIVKYPPLLGAVMTILAHGNWNKVMIFVKIGIAVGRPIQLV